MLVVLDGCVQIVGVNRQGKKIDFNLIKAGDVFGELSLLDGGPRSADARALQDTELLALHRDDFLALLRRRPEISLHLLELLCARLRRTSEQVEDLVGTIAIRLARVLPLLAAEHGHPSDDGRRIDLRLSQREFGRHTGTTRETLNRQLGEWCEHGIIKLEDGHTVVCDERALRKICDGLV